MRTPLLSRGFGPLSALLLAIMAAQMFTAARDESQTFDEAVHLTAGYRYWKTGDFSMNIEHPPLQKLLSGAALLPLGLKLPDDPKIQNDQWEFAKTFLYRNVVPADTILLRGRLVTIGLTILLGAALVWWARRRFGPAAALAVAVLFTLDANFMAHGRLVTTDAIASLFFFLTFAAWFEFLWSERPAWRWAIATGVFLGLALAAKFSAIILLPVLPAMLLLRWPGWRGAIAGTMIALWLPVPIVAASYWPETAKWMAMENPPRLREHTDKTTLIGYLLRGADRHLHLPPHTWFLGLHAVAQHDKEGHNAYLLGQQSDRGWWYYFPVAFFVKTPAALLLLAALALVAGWRGQWRTWATLLVPVALYFAVSMSSRINIGFRHLLPVFPFLMVLAAVTATRVLPPQWRVGVAAAALGLHLFEAVRIAPYHLAFFNVFAGGPQAGPKYLVDSNLDWGQDLKRLKARMERERWNAVCLEYFGYADPKEYGIKAEYLPKTWNKGEMEWMNCVGAISATLLQDVYIQKGSFEWLRRREPMGTVGYSIYLYDLRKDLRK
ncbi:MAG: phospholipid carrier-dependent glycosyltransferase [Bryobacteraceae bacterium]|nr:phospholipid carrier-dependent glycosyltransferase [Bryobacteraceae bacterium]